MGKAGSKIQMCTVYCVFGSDILHVSYLTLSNSFNGNFSCERCIQFQKFSYAIALALLMFVQLQCNMILTIMGFAALGCRF